MYSGPYPFSPVAVTQMPHKPAAKTEFAQFGQMKCNKLVY